LLWHAINKGLLIDWSTIVTVVSVLISDKIIIMQRL